MCKFLRNFTVPILCKIETTIDFSGPESQHLSLKLLKNRMVNIFKASSIFLMIVVDNLHYNLFHLVICHSYAQNMRQN